MNLTIAASKNPLAVGYARLDCSEPVNAALIYDLIAPNQSTVTASSAVFAAPQTTYAMFPVFLLSDWRTALNIVNDTDVAANYTVDFTASNGHVTGIILTLPPRTHLARFLDELMSLPSGPGTGSVVLFSVGTTVCCNRAAVCG